MTKSKSAEAGFNMKLVAKMPVSGKRSNKRKPKDKPKRPLSAYNFFFKNERAKILEALNDPSTSNDFTEESLDRLRKEGGKVSFEQMGKLIGHRWKKIDKESLKKYSDQAVTDGERYKKEMIEYNGRQEAKMRSDALKPQPSIPCRENALSSIKAEQEGSRGYHEGMPGLHYNGGYPFAMDYATAYGMPPMMYTPYYGVPAPNGQGGEGASTNGSTSHMYPMMGYGYPSHADGNQPYGAAAAHGYNGGGDGPQWASAGQQ